MSAVKFYYKAPLFQAVGTIPLHVFLRILSLLHCQGPVQGTLSHQIGFTQPREGRFLLHYLLYRFLWRLLSLLDLLQSLLQFEIASILLLDVP